MKKNIEALWMGRPIITELTKEEKDAFSEKRGEAQKSLSDLEGHLDSEGQRLLNKYLIHLSNLNDLERKNAFVQGFSLGVKLIAEGLED